MADLSGKFEVELEVELTFLEVELEVELNFSEVELEVELTFSVVELEIELTFSEVEPTSSEVELDQPRGIDSIRFPGKPPSKSKGPRQRPRGACISTQTVRYTIHDTPLPVFLMSPCA